MLTPIEMLAKKNRLPLGLWLGMLLALFAAGCTPSGPRAVRRGEKMLETGDYTGAVAQLRVATSLLPSNAAAWNYLGVACQKAQLPAEAVTAYQRALALNRDLVEVHWNLGMLYLEQGKNDLAEPEFTAYTLRRNYSPEGWLKLGTAQLRLGQPAAAERSFGAVQTLDKNNAESLNGLGLALLEQKQPREAVQYFAAANQAHPDYAPAILNLAVAAQQYLRDDRLALEYYHAYLGLTPRPDHWQEVSDIVNSLEPGVTAAAPASVTPPVEARLNTPPPPALASVPASRPAPTPVQPVTNDTRRPTVAVVHLVPAPKPVPVIRSNPAPVAVRPPPASPPAATVAVSAPAARVLSPDHPLVEPPPTNAVSAAKPGLWAKLKPTHWFEPEPLDQKYENNGGTSPGAEPVDNPPAMKAPPVFARYGYLAPARPQPGNRRGASGAFNKARMDEQGSRWMEAMQNYRTAAELDPGWFEAQYNYGILSYRLGNPRQALGAYEMALAIQPEDVDARYNFALALKAAGFVPDAVNELKKVLAADTDEIRAHLALANLYAQKLHDTVPAREHYLKVLDLDPNNPQAGQIRAWLAANSY